MKRRFDFRERLSHPTAGNFWTTRQAVLCHSPDVAGLSSIELAVLPSTGELPPPLMAKFTKLRARFIHASITNHEAICRTSVAFSAGCHPVHAHHGFHDHDAAGAAAHAGLEHRSRPVW